MPLIGARATASRCYFGEKEEPGAPVITSSTPGPSFLSIAFDAPTFNGGLTITRYEQAFSTDDITWSPWALAISSTSPPTSPVRINGLTNGQAYYVKIRAINSMGVGPESNVWNTTTTPSTTPDAPTLSSVTRGYRQLTVAFTAPAFNGGSAITDYEFSTNNGTSWTSMAQSDTTDYAITGLADFTSYNVRVRAVNAAGSGSGSNMLAGITAGLTNAPSGLSAGSNGVFQSPLSWTAPESNASPISDYIVQRSTFSNFSSDVVTFSDGVSTSTSTTVTGLSASITYYFRVAAVNQVGQSGWSSIVSATTAGVPSQVSTPTSSSGDRVFTISWSTPAGNGSSVTSYTVQYSSNGGSSWSTAETFSSGSSEFTNRTKSWVLNNGVSYVGRVLATNAVGNGAYSSASTARTPVFSAPVLTANASYNSEAEKDVRRITWSVDPTDVRSSTSSAGTTTRVYLQRMNTDNTPSHAEQLIATYTGNATNGSFGTSFTTSGTVAAGQQYRIRAEQFSSEDTGYVVGTAWINLTVIAQQSRQPDPVVTSSVVQNVVVYTTGTFKIDRRSFSQLSTKFIPGVNTTTGGSVRYSIKYFEISAVGQDSSSASSTRRNFMVLYAANDTAGNIITQSSPNSNTWQSPIGTFLDYTWDITPDTPFGNAGAGRVTVVGGGSLATSWGTEQIWVTMTAYGDKQTWTSTPQPLITW
jgi:hypothetical protein